MDEPLNCIAYLKGEHTYVFRFDSPAGGTHILARATEDEELEFTRNDAIDVIRKMKELYHEP